MIVNNKIMKKITLFLVLSLSAILFISCSGSTGGGGEDNPPVDMYPLTLTASKTVIAADSIDETTITVKYKGVVITDSVELYLNDSLIEPINLTFKTDVAGAYKFRAKKGTDNSPVLVITAKKEINRNPGTFLKKALTLYLTTTWCNNCPDAMEIIKAAHADYPNRIVTLTWHSIMKGPIHDPFGLEQTQSIMTWLGGVGGFPMVNIDNERMLWPGSGDKREYEYSLYETPTAGMVGMAIETELKGRTLTGKVKVKNSDASLVKKNMLLNVVITENGLVANQIMPNGSANPSYVHDHVVRHVITPLTVNGTQFGHGIPADQLALDATYEYEFTYQVPEADIYVPGEYNMANMTVAAFVNMGGVFIAAQEVKFGETIDFQYNKK